MKLVKDAVDQLQAGEESIAKSSLDQAIQHDPGNELAHKLLDQIKADAQRDLGSAFFRYTIQPEDTLSKLAQRFLNDRYRFYILAKYNDLQVPNKLAVGQVIKIPGQEPKGPPATPKQAPRPVEALPKAPEPATKPPPEDPVKVVPVKVVPANTPASVNADAARHNSILRLNLDAEICQRKQNLDCAIQKWGQVLELDPDNQSARLKRERAATLKQQLKDIPAK